MTEERFAKIVDELRETACICEMSALLSPLPDDELQSVFDVFVDQYGQELAVGALECSDWLCGTLVINANQFSIDFLGAALQVMRGEMERRRTASGVPATGSVL